MIFGGLLAGGKGIRMGSTDLPKQFLSIDQKPIIIHTLEKMLLISQIDIVYIGILGEWGDFCQDLIDKYLSSFSHRVKVVDGGSSRNETIFSIISAIKSNYEVTDEDILVSHDAVRPFVTARIIHENIQKAIEYGCCDTVIYAFDTVVNSNDGKFVTDIPDRSTLYRGQTPQTFKINLFLECYETLSEEQKNTLTDACKIFILNGKPVAIVEGEVSNFKITANFDYEMASILVKTGNMDINEVQDDDH